MRLSARLFSAAIYLPISKLREKKNSIPISSVLYIYAEKSLTGADGQVCLPCPEVGGSTRQPDRETGGRQKTDGTNAPSAVGACPAVV